MYTYLIGVSPENIQMFWRKGSTVYYLLHSKREITMKGIAKIIDYIMSHLPMTWDHPFLSYKDHKSGNPIGQNTTNKYCINAFMVFTSEYQWLLHYHW